ncbi:bifunctional alpha,alpha-trehalose-phosphate synthase (UDP-forming)/trehalose-phosphatase [Candidatus Bathyarchaeota archaeon]|nr:bifunctional alpha,alpha-trehalose-phosphate synthase (UDP-forming)/trehalose-phosphatase [Candidatus Bathyarchaeota archaeon]
MGKLIIVSNRLPISVSKRRGELRIQPSVGGLATGIKSFYKSHQAVWVGWPGIFKEALQSEEVPLVERRLEEEKCHPIWLSKYDIENYYYGFSNKTLWPLFSYFPNYAVFNAQFWRSYVKVNKIFAEEVEKLASSDDMIWIHDYHLMLLPKLLRERLPEASIGFFLHIPFPSFEIFRLLPWRKEVLEGLMGADLIGFHTYDCAKYFLESVRRILGYEYSLNYLFTEDRIIKVDAFPMGIDYEKFASLASNPRLQREVRRLREKLKTEKIILSVDRLDYSKGIPQKLEAYERFLDKNPGFRGQVTLIMVVVPSRTRVEHYVNLKKKIDEMVGRINGKFAAIGWSPIWYIYGSLPFEKLAALYLASDVLLISSLRDGMNLIAKEYLAANESGTLILSEMAGAAKELCEAIIINPNNISEVMEAIKSALTMNKNETRKRNMRMRERLKRYTVTRWARDFVESLLQVKKKQQEMATRRLSDKTAENLVIDYKNSKTRLVILDYDGTLVPFFGRPDEAKPDTELLGLLEKLSENCNLVIISGRDKETLENWLGHLNIGLVAEHGFWIKDGEKWRLMMESLSNEWKDELKRTLQIYVDRTPGSFLEEKDFSLVWHYRNVDPELALVRVNELKDALLTLVGSYNLEILEGDKVIEVKNAGINKGVAASYWLSKENWDFILAMGDDWTDEYVFEVLPEKSYSIKIRPGLSKAKYYINSVRGARLLLRKLITGP